MNKSHVATADKLAVTIAEAAKMSSLSRSMLYQLITCGEGPKVRKVHSRSIIIVDDLRVWLKGR